MVFSGALGAQSAPKDLPWAVVTLVGEGEWTLRVPQLLVRGWDRLPPHRLTEDEKTALRLKARTEALRSVDQQVSRLRLDLDRKRLVGSLPSSEPAATEKSLAEAATRRQAIEAGEFEGANPPASLPLRAVWGPGRDNLPWPSGTRPELLLRTQAAYLVSGSVRAFGEFLSVRLELYSAWEGRVLVQWEGQFASDEAPQRVADAADAFRSALLGRPWAGLAVSSPLTGAKIRFQGVWHSLPWASDELEAGTYELAVQSPGRVDELRTVVLEPETRTKLELTVSEPAHPLVIDTVPSGVPLYLDSRYLGLSPQSVDRPLSTSRVRAQDPAWKTSAWEIGPDTVSPSVRILVPPTEPPSVLRAKDRFYTSLAAFSFSLTSSAFLGAWSEEQVRLTNAYAAAGAVTGYQLGKSRYEWVTAGYSASVVLTSVVFVWMMFELGDYLGAAQSSLP